MSGKEARTLNDVDTPDAVFREAVSAIDAGDVAMLERLVARHPGLVGDRLASPGPWLRDKVGDALDGFFARPYLLWFVAEDPVRNGKLPRNIAQVTRTIIRAAERESVGSLREQLDYALRLVAWSWVARECDVQLELIDVLVEAGASPDGKPDAAVYNGNYAAAERLLEKGARLTLQTALCLGRFDDARRLASAATTKEKQNALVMAALQGNAEAVHLLLELGVDPNTIGPDVQSHATAVHHAVWSGSLEAVKVLVEAGASLDTRDTIHDGTPLEWAEYGKRAEIAAYLRDHNG